MLGVDPLTHEPDPRLCTEEFEPVNAPKTRLINLNALLIEEGFTLARSVAPFAKQETFRKLEKEAKRSGRGLWGTRSLNWFESFTEKIR